MSFCQKKKKVGRRSGAPRQHCTFGNGWSSGYQSSKVHLRSLSLTLSLSLRTGCHIDATQAGQHCQRCHGKVYPSVFVCRRYTCLDTPWCSIFLCGGRTGNSIRGPCLDSAGVLITRTDAEGEMCHPPLVLFLFPQPPVVFLQSSSSFSLIFVLFFS